MTMQKDTINTQPGQWAFGRGVVQKRIDMEHKPKSLKQ